MQTADLLEREAVVAGLSTLVDGVWAGRSCSAFVTGAAGLGKTSVLGAAAKAAESRGLAVFRVCGQVMESAIPFGGLDQLLAELGGLQLRESTPPPVGGADLRMATYSHALTAMRRLPGGLIILDDLHWSDADSIAFVGFLCRRLCKLPAAWGVLGAMRMWPADGFEMCRGLVHDEHASVIGLQALSEAGAAKLMSSRIDRELTLSAIRDAWVTTAGNPLLLQQAAEMLQRGDRVATADGSSAEENASHLLLSRFGGVPPAGIRWLQAAAVLGSRFVPEVVCRVAGLRDDEHLAAMEAAIRGGLITAQPSGRCDFVHQLFRDALYTDLPAPLRMRLHGRAMTELDGRGLDADAAEHAARAYLVGDSLSIGILQRAGLAAAADGAFAAAADRLRAAVELSGAHSTPALLLAFGRVLVACPRSDEAITILRRLLLMTTVESSIQLDALRYLARAECVAGELKSSWMHFEEAVSAAEQFSAQMTVEVLLEWSQSMWHLSPAKALPMAARARTLARSCDRQIRILAELVWTHQALQTGDPSGLTELSRLGLSASAIDDAYPPQQAAASWSPQAAIVGAAILTEQYDGDHGRFLRMTAAAESSGAPEAAGMFVLMHAHGLVRLGRLREALDALSRARGMLDRVPALEATMNAAYAYIHLLDGRLADSLHYNMRAADLATRRGEINPLLYVHETRGHRALREGDLDLACREYSELEQLIDQMGIGEPCLVAWVAHAIEAHLAAGHDAEVNRVIGWLTDRSAVLPCHFPRIALATAQAMRADADGDTFGADAHYHNALAFHQGVTLPIEKVQTLLGYGKFLRRRRQPARARILLHEAIAISEAVGAHWLTDLARTELAVAGGRRRVDRQPDQLTPAERRVAALAHAGHGNRRIAAQLSISETTVETHLSHIYVKLSISSRHQLPAPRRPDPKLTTSAKHPG